MKILTLTNLYPPDFTGGYELGCGQAVAGLRRRGHEVRVLTSAPRTPVPAVPHVYRWLRLADLSNAYYMARCRPAATAVHAAESHLISAFNVHRLTAALEEFRPDVCYVWNVIGLGGLGLMACLEYLGVPWVWHLMDAVPAVLCSPGGTVLPPLAEEVQGRLDGRYLVCSRRVAWEIRARGIVLPGRVDVIPNWIRGERPAPRTRYYQGGTLRAVYAGQIGRHKGTDILIEAAGLLRGRGHQNFSIDLYGKVTDPSFPHRVNQLGLGRHMIFRGLHTQDELADLYRTHAYDLFVFPTWEREPFAFAPLEAAAYGCVPLISRFCGNADWAIDGRDCIKADRDPHAFAAALGEILEGRTDLERLGRRAEAVAWRYFHLDGLLPRIETALEEQSRRPRRRAGSTQDACRMAVMAEKLVQVLVQEAA